MFIKNNWPGILWGVIILIITGIPGNYFPKVTTFWDWLSPDKIVHLFLFSIFVLLLNIGFKKQYTSAKQRSNYIIASLLIGIVFSGLTEILQRFIFVRRNGNIYDFAANSAGCFLGVLLFYIFFRQKFKKNIDSLKNI